MVPFYKELQPADSFQISLPQSLSNNERQMLTLLYQPLLGAVPVSLYLTLWAEGEQNAEEMTHYYLMEVLSMSIKQILEARIALEAIGLLKTFRRADESSRQFIYQIIPPLDANSFFNDPLLSMFLFSKIGEIPYRKLRKRFAKQVSFTGFEDVSRSFVDVFKPVHKNVPADGESLQEVPKREIPFYYDQFNFQLLKDGLSEQFVPSSIWTVEVKDIISKLAFLYGYTPIDMQKIVLRALDENNQLSVEQLKKIASEHYKYTVSTDPPKLSKTYETVDKQEVLKQTRESERLHLLDTMSPIQYLRDMNEGIEPVPSSVQLVEDLILKYKMPFGVVNVLLEYTLLKTDMKLPRKYVERIADHWMRKNLKSAKEAMELARKEWESYKEWKQSDTQSKTKNASTKKGRVEAVPEWFNNRQKAGENNQTNTSSVDFEKEKQLYLEKLNKLK